MICWGLRWLKKGLVPCCRINKLRLSALKNLNAILPEDIGSIGKGRLKSRHLGVYMGIDVDFKID